jgi:benzoyl-CoA reductase/2-hydroxyglutaryl-CoA dehydratase subunit BcrC/BadD/HgdB
MMDVLDRIKDLASSPYNTYLDEAKKSGAGIIGYFCSYVPEELIHAAGFIPYRMRAVGSKGTTKGDMYYSSINCTFVRHCFDKALQGDFDFLDGVIFLNGCDHTRRMYDNWRHAKIKPDFLYMCIAPHVVTESALKQYTEECRKLQHALEGYFKIKITEEALHNSIKLYNKKRQLLSQIYELRKRKDVPISGSSVLSVLLAITAIPVSDAISLLEEVLAFIQNRNVSAKNDLRIFISGGCVEEPDHLSLIEKCGCVIVADDLCLGSRHFNTLSSESDNPLDAIAKRYLYHLSCPRMMGDFSRRFNYVDACMKDYKIDGIIIEKLKFCDIWGGEIFLCRTEAKKLGFPLLALERELYGGGEGQIRTRVQAFFEKIRNQETLDEELVRAAGDEYKPKI